MNEKIMVVEDDESIRKVLEVVLKSHGYETVCFANATEALAEMQRESPTVAVFDIMMEGLDGIEAVKRIRQNEHMKMIPVIMLTAKDAEIDKIIGLDAGADDYMTKPFSVLELCARVRAQIRRVDRMADVANDLAIYEKGGLCLNVAAREVVQEGRLIELTFKEFELLKILIENPGKVLQRSELLCQIWGENFFGETRTLDIHIGTLRQKLGDTAEESRYIKTVRGMGYRFVGRQE